jgi:hypothetical protein
MVRHASSLDQFLDCCLVLPSRTALGSRAGVTSPRDGIDRTAYRAPGSSARGFPPSPT